MDVIRTCVSLMALEDKDTKDNSPKANMRKAMRIFAKTPTAVAAYFRTRKGKSIIAPSKKLSFSENFFKMMFNKVPDKEIGLTKKIVVRNGKYHLTDTSSKKIRGDAVFEKGNLVNVMEKNGNNDLCSAQILRPNFS